MEIVVIGLLVFGGYKFLRYTIRSGREAVRAFVYLEALKRGGSQRDANETTDTILDVYYPEQAKNLVMMAKHQIQTLHAGKQLPLIAYAYRYGMRAAMPGWYRKMALRAPKTRAIELTYGGLSKFVVEGGEAREAAAEMPTHEGYDAFYRVYADEVHRLSGKGGSDINIADFMEDEPLLRAYRDGIDPLTLAAAFCDEHGITKERYQTFESYVAAFRYELSRFASDTAQLDHWLARVDPARIDSSFQKGVHPRRAADGYFHYMTQP